MLNNSQPAFDEEMTELFSSFERIEFDRYVPDYQLISPDEIRIRMQTNYPARVLGISQDVL